MTYDSSRTRANILAAAEVEFADHGLAGARVDRIAARALANKKQIYVHFGSKEGLFDTVVASAVERLVGEVPITPDDLGGYAGRVYDALTTDTQVFRLAMWRQLERPISTKQESILYAEKLGLLEAQRTDLELHPAHTIATILALAQMWLIASPVLDALARSNTVDRRRSIEQITERLFATERRDSQ